MQFMLQIFTATAMTKPHEHKLRVQIETESVFFTVELVTICDLLTCVGGCIRYADRISTA
jgi:hypothetical protein